MRYVLSELEPDAYCSLIPLTTYRTLRPTTAPVERDQRTSRLEMTVPKPPKPTCCPRCGAIERCRAGGFSLFRDGDEISHGTRSHFVLDHNHRTGANRAWICTRCNDLIGRYEHAYNYPKETALTERYLLGHDPDYRPKRRPLVLVQEPGPIDE